MGGAMGGTGSIVHGELPGVSVAEHQLGEGVVVAVTGSAVVYAVEGDVSIISGSERVMLLPGDAVAAAELVVAGSGRALVVAVPAVVDAQLAAGRCFRADARNHYSWGDGCDGWRLLEHPALSVRQERMPPGTAETTHVHIEAHQVFYALTGRPVMALPDREYPLAPGASIAVPPRVPHQMRNRGPGDSTFLAISAPATAADRSDVDSALVAQPATDPLPPSTALLVIDVQQAFADPGWGARNNPRAEANIARLLQAFRATGRPVVHVHHRNTEPSRRFHPDNPGHAPKPEAAPLSGEQVLTKTVNSAFIGTDLEQRLRGDGITHLVVCGLTTDHCVSTTARMAANLGFRVRLVADATATFDRTGPDGRRWSAQDIHDAALASLHDEFATVVTTDDMTAATAPSQRLTEAEK